MIDLSYENGWLHDKVKEQAAEIERLRAALKVVTKTCAYGGDMCDAFDAARRALEGK